MLESQDEDDYESFQSEHDYVFALWLHRSENIKRDVNRFFKNSRMKHFHDQLSFKNEDQWLTQLSKVKNEFSKNKWIEQDIIIAFKVIDEFDDVVKIQYRNVIETIKFFLNHFLFRADLAYAFVCQFNNKKKRVYTEMHTEDWWWQKQTEVHEKTTIVSLFIASDKTMLFQHQKNQAVWFVYLIIENLSRRVRRSQTRLNDLLLKFISQVHSSSSDRLKAKIWHEILTLMLERMLVNIQFTMIQILTLICYQL
jgi:hypothetical protein